jgi:hypothetical protein
VRRRVAEHNEELHRVGIPRCIQDRIGVRLVEDPVVGLCEVPATASDIVLMAVCTAAQLPVNTGVRIKTPCVKGRSGTSLKSITAKRAPGIVDWTLLQSAVACAFACAMAAAMLPVVSIAMMMSAAPGSASRCNVLFTVVDAPACSVTLAGSA